MDIALSNEQKDIAREARRFLKKECPVDYVAAMFEDGSGHDEKLWEKIIQLDWLGMCIPEQYGGMGMKLTEMVMVLEETGRALLPGPFFTTAMYAAETIAAAGNESQRATFLPRIAKGRLRGSLAVFEPEGGADPSYIQMQAEPGEGGWVLNGTKILVPDAHVSDVIICAARTRRGDHAEEGITLFMVDTNQKGVEPSVLPTMDAVRKYGAVRFHQVLVPTDRILGEVHKGWLPLSRSMDRTAVGICAECIGGAQYAMEKAVDYAKNRIQFGQPIGAFQAIKHMCAQMYVDVESSRSLLYYAAWAQDNEDFVQSAVAASAAKAFIPPMFDQVVCNAIQVLGGTGFVWEDELHYYLRRAKAHAIALGDQAYHHDRLLKLLSF